MSKWFLRSKLPVWVWLRQWINVWPSYRILSLPARMGWTRLPRQPRLADLATVVEKSESVFYIFKRSLNSWHMSDNVLSSRLSEYLFNSQIQVYCRLWLYGESWRVSVNRRQIGKYHQTIDLHLLWHPLLLTLSHIFGEFCMTGASVAS